MNQPRLRTKNVHERRVIDELIADGYTVLKRGWPDLLAFSVEKKRVRFVEVKPPYGGRTVKHCQKDVADVLALLGIQVEVANGTITDISKPIAGRRRRRGTQ